MTRRSGLLFLTILLLTGCGSKEQTKTYALRGVIKSLDAGAKLATIQHEKIGDWMEAMTMEFPVKPDSEFQKLQVGQRIQAKVVVGDSSYYITEVQVVPQ